MEYDVVYILKNDIDPSELRYSLRSLENFPHGKVWFFGGAPEGIKPDRQVIIRQHGATKWEKVRNTIRTVCETDEVSSSFWLFNDDFFCMKPCGYFPPIFNGTLYSRIVEIENRAKAMTPYSLQLRKTAELLDSKDMDVLNYAVHLPMLIDKQRALVVLDEFKTCPMFRSLYGNSCGIGGLFHKDVKIYDPKEEPDPDAYWLSTTNESFSKGKVGEYIRKQFQKECVYELG